MLIIVRKFMPINNDRTENSKIYFSGNEKSRFNSKKDIVI